MDPINTMLFKTHKKSCRLQRQSIQYARSLLVPEETVDFAGITRTTIGCETFPAVCVITSMRLLICCRKTGFSRFYSCPLDAIRKFQEYNAINYKLKITTSKTVILLEMNKQDGEVLAESVAKLQKETFDYSADSRNKIFSEAYLHQKIRLAKRAKIQ